MGVNWYFEYRRYIVSTMACLLQAQTNAIAAQAKAVAVQNLPPLPCYTGENSDVVDDGYDKWVQRFRERARFASWSVEDQLYQLKLHLDKVFRMLPDPESSNIESAITVHWASASSPRTLRNCADWSFITKLKVTRALTSWELVCNSSEGKLSPQLLARILIDC